MNIVTLLTDFGLKDAYVAQMKGILLNCHPSSVLVDITHDVERHNISMGSFILETAAPYFPRGTIHVAVVDPEVGSSRDAVAIECKDGILVGPDNGLMARASEQLGFKSAYRIQNKEFHRDPLSTTFHGRDIFAYTAGLLASGRQPEEVGPRINRLVRLRLPRAKLTKRRILGRVSHVDSFGNVVTNVSDEMLRRARLRFGEELEIRSGTGTLRAQYVRSYHELERGELGALLGSQGFLEIAVREGNAREKLGVEAFDRIEVRH